MGVPLPPPRAQAPSAFVRSATRVDASAEDELVARFQAGLLGHLTRRLHDREAARELANDVLMAAVQAVREDRIKDPERLPGFVYGIARNLVNSYLRMRHAHPAGEPLQPDIAIEDPGSRLEQRERLALVRDGLESLQHMERQILMMTLDGLKPGTIASHLGLSSQVVRARKSRAVRKLEAHLGFPHGPPRPRRPWRIR
jgi:RNA polymerase sigma factor (sigma-70 family)